MVGDPAASPAASPAAFKDLVIDAQDAPRMAQFWGAVTGLTARSNDGRPGAVLQGAAPEHIIWVNQVPEPRTVKQRVHLDLHVAAIDDLLDLGARVDTQHPRWTVMRDPEQGEFCAFVRDPATLTDYRVYELVVDAADPESIAGWWADRLGTTAEADGDSSWYVLPGGTGGLPWDVVFDVVPEPKTVKNRIHWDVWGDTEEFLRAGARLLRARDHEIGWDVLADPEGNEFCVFTR